MTKIVLALLSGMTAVSCTAACAKVQPGSNATRSQQPSRSNAAPKKNQQPMPPALWQQYFHAGIDFEKRGDLTKAKQYYLYALSLLEKTKPTTNHLTSGLAHLESHIMKIYKARAKGAAKIQQDEEEIAVLTRLQQLNQIYKDSGNRLDNAVQAQQKTAAADLKNVKGTQ